MSHLSQKFIAILEMMTAKSTDAVNMDAAGITELKEAIINTRKELQDEIKLVEKVLANNYMILESEEMKIKFKETLKNKKNILHFNVLELENKNGENKEN